MKQYRKLLLELCLGSLRGAASHGVTAEGMEALTKVLAQLREGDVGPSFKAISEQCRLFFDHVSADKSCPPGLSVVWAAVSSRYTDHGILWGKLCGAKFQGISAVECEAGRCPL